jgi:hypothetical protein
MKIFGTLAEIQDHEDIAKLIIDSCINFGKAAGLKTRSKYVSVMPKYKVDYKEKVLSAEAKALGKTIQVEEKRKGLVSLSTYWYYWSSGGVILFSFMLMFQMMIVGTNVGSAYWLSRWASAGSGNSTSMCLIGHLFVPAIFSFFAWGDFFFCLVVACPFLFVSLFLN